MLVELEQDIQNPAVRMLIEALNGVEETYMEQPYYISGQRPERVFAAELYHQLRKLQEDTTNAEPNAQIAHLSFHAEPTKRGDLGYQITVCSNERARSFNPAKVSPDLVLHKSQINRERDNQLLACEIKMDGCGRNGFEKDLLKLLLYKSSRFRFQDAVFIYTGSKERIEDFLSQLNSPQPSSPCTILPCLQDQKIVFVLKSEKSKKREQNNCYQWEAHVIDKKRVSPCIQ